MVKVVEDCPAKIAISAISAISPKIVVGVDEHQRPEINYMWICPTLICHSLRQKKGISVKVTVTVTVTAYVDPQHFAVLT